MLPFVCVKGKYGVEQEWGNKDRVVSVPGVENGSMCRVKQRCRCLPLCVVGLACEI